MSTSTTTQERSTGRRVLRWIAVLVAVALWVVLLFTVVFPRVEQVLNTDPTLDVETEPAPDEG